MKRMVPNAVGRAGGAPEAGGAVPEAGGAVPEARAEWRRGRPRGAAATGDASVSASVRSVASVLIDGRLPSLVSDSDRNIGQDRSHDGFWRSLTGAQRERSVLAVRERAGSAAEGWADKRLVEAIKRRLYSLRTTTPSTKRVRERDRERRERERDRERRERERREREPQLGSRGFVPVPLRRAGGKEPQSAGQRLSLSGRAHKAGRGHEALEGLEGLQGLFQRGRR